MRLRTSIIAAILTANLTITLACNIGSSEKQGAEQPANPAQPSPEIPVDDALCNNPLYPVRPGAAWTYSSTGSPSGDFSYTDTISEARADGFTLSTQFTGLVRTQEWVCEPGGLKALEMGGAGAAASVSTQGTTAEFESSDVTGISLPKEITPGMQWQYSLKMTGVTAMPGDQNAQSSGTYNQTMQEMGRESVTVPAGTFEAVKFQATSLIQLTADFQGVQLPVTMYSSSLIWYAPGVGFIKSVENSDFGGTPYTSTTELQTYSIP